jgi:antitoxin ParD1/3/4
MPSSVDLGRELEKFVSALIRSGRYNSKSEVLREGVRLIRERETRLAALDAAIARPPVGPTCQRSRPFDRLDAKYRALAKPRPDDRRHHGSGGI